MLTGDRSLQLGEGGSLSLIQARAGQHTAHPLATGLREEKVEATCSEQNLLCEVGGVAAS